MLSQPHAPWQPVQASQPGTPVSGQVGTYPAGLRQALERCSQYGHQRQYGVVWEVITDVTDEYSGSRTEVVGTYESLQEANMQSTIVFLDEGYYTEDFSPVYEVKGDGSLAIQNEFDGGCVEIYIKKQPAGRTLGPKR